VKKEGAEIVYFSWDRKEGMYGKRMKMGNEGKRICASKEEEEGVLLTDESFHLRFSLVLLVSGGFSEEETRYCEFAILLACKQSQPGFIWSETAVMRRCMKM
jgi:hypothetical protein